MGEGEENRRDAEGRRGTQRRQNGKQDHERNITDLRLEISKPK